jgi:DNA-directed RNA polymerase
MFSGAHEIQEWLKECAKRISKSLGPKDLGGEKPSHKVQSHATVVWTSPVGLPVCQPYRRQDTKAIRTLMTDILLANPNEIGPVNSRKQATAFPPNFIHSLDASHMLKSAIACEKAGLSFAAVHDSFWTHAADVDVMNVILREAFVRMHQGDLVEKLRAEFLERYKGHYYPADSSIEQGKIKTDENSIDDEVTNGQLLKRVPKKKGQKWIPLELPPVPKKARLFCHL